MGYLEKLSLENFSNLKERGRVEILKKESGIHFTEPRGTQFYVLEEDSATSDTVVIYGKYVSREKIK